MAESHSAETLRLASSIIARHGSQAGGFAETVATHFRAAGSDADARQWTSISTAIHDIEQAVPLPNLNRSTGLPGLDSRLQCSRNGKVKMPG